MLYFTRDANHKPEYLLSILRRVITLSLSVLQWRLTCDALCPAGFRPPDCIHNCPRGQYGLGCASMCPITCYTPTCRPDTGHCFRCRLGFRGPMCNKKCVEGSFGQDCIHSCGENCLGYICDAFTGACSACEPGFFGTRCDQVGHMPQGKNFLTKLLTDLWERTNDTDSLASIIAMQARLDQERRRRPIVGEDERQAFYTASIFVCAIVPICLLGMCLYCIKEKIKSSFSDLLSKKRWTRARDGFFSKIVIPTSKSNLIQSQSRDNYKTPLVKSHPKDNTRNNYEVNFQPKGYVNQRIVSTQAMNPDVNIPVLNFASPQVELTQSSVKSSTPESHDRSGDANHQHKAIQSEDSAWTADMDITVPVGHHDPKKDGFITRPRAFWRRLFQCKWRKNHQHKPKDPLTLTKPTTDGHGEDTPNDLPVPAATSPQTGVMLEAATESSSSESDTSTSSTTIPAHGKVFQEGVGFPIERGQGPNASPTKKKRWSSPVYIRRLFGTFHNSKEEGSGSPMSRAAASGDGKILTQLLEEQEPKVVFVDRQSHAPSSFQKQDERTKLFERLKRNVMEELRLLQAMEEANNLPTRSASDQVLAKSTQTRGAEYSDVKDFKNGKVKGSYFRHMLGLGNRQSEFEEAKSVASMGKMMSLKFRISKMFNRSPYHKLRGLPLSHLGKSFKDFTNNPDFQRMELDRTLREAHEKQVKNCSLNKRELIMTRLWSPDKIRACIEKEKMNSPSLASGPCMMPMFESTAQGNLTQQSPPQKYTALDTRQSVGHLNRKKVQDSLKRQHLESASPMHRFQLEDLYGALSQMQGHTRQEVKDALVGDSEKIATMVNTATSPRSLKCVSHQTSPIRSVKSSPLPSHKTNRGNLVTSRNFQMQFDTYPNDRCSPQGKLCDRGQSPGDMGSGKSKVSHEKPLTSESSKEHLESITVENDQEIKKISKEISVQERSRIITQSPLEQKDKSSIKSGKESSPPLLRTTGNAHHKVGTEEHRISKKVSSGKGNAVENSTNILPLSANSFRKPTEEKTYSIDLPSAEPEESLTSTPNKERSEKVHEGQATPHSRAPFFGVNVLRANYVTSQPIASFSPNIQFAYNASKIGQDVKIARDRERVDIKPIIRNTPIHVPIVYRCGNIGQASVQPVLNRGKRTQMFLNERNKLEWFNAANNRVTQAENVMKTKYECHESYANFHPPQSRACPYSAHSNFSANGSPAPKQACQAPGQYNQSQDTMTFSDPMIKTPRSIDSSCVIVHAYENRKANVLENIGRPPQKSSGSSTPLSSSTQSEIILEDHLISPEPRPLDSKEKTIQSVSLDSTVQQTVPEHTHKYPATQSFCPREAMSTNVIEISDTMKSLSTSELTPFEQTGTTTQLSLLNESYKYNAGNNPQLSSSTGQDKRHRLWLSKQAAQREQRGTTKTQACDQIFKECNEMLTSHCGPEPLPVPTLLEHSLQLMDSFTHKKIANKAVVSEVCSTGPVKRKSSVEITAAHGPTLRDNEEFRSIQEPSSERYYDALEPDPKIWAKLHCGKRGPLIRQIRHQEGHQKDTSKSSRTVVKTTSSRPTKVTRKSSEHHKTANNSVFRLAPKEFKEKQKIIYKDRNNPDSKIVLRFACPSTDPTTGSFDSEGRRSRSCRRIEAGEKRSRHAQDKRRNKSVGPECTTRERNSTGNHPKSERSQKHRTVDLNLKKPGQRGQPIASSSEKRETIQKGVKRGKGNEMPSNQHVSKTVENSETSNLLSSKTDSQRYVKDHETKAKARPKSSVPKQNNPNENETFPRAISQTENNHSSLHVQNCPQIAEQNAQTIHPGFHKQTFPAHAVSNVQPAVNHQYIQKPVQHNVCSSCNTQNHAVVQPRFPLGQQPPRQKHPQSLETDSSNIGNNYLAPVLVCNPNNSNPYRQSLDRSNFQNEASQCVTYPIATPHAVSDRYRQNIRQGPAPASALYRAQHGQSVAPPCNEQNSTNARYLPVEFAPGQYCARIPTSGSLHLINQLPSTPASLPPPLHPSN